MTTAQLIAASAISAASTFRQRVWRARHAPAASCDSVATFPIRSVLERTSRANEVPRVIVPDAARGIPSFGIETTPLEPDPLRATRDGGSADRRRARLWRSAQAIPEDEAFRGGGYRFYRRGGGGKFRSSTALSHSPDK